MHDDPYPTMCKSNLLYEYRSQSKHISTFYAYKEVEMNVKTCTKTYQLSRKERLQVHVILKNHSLLINE